MKKNTMMTTAVAVPSDVPVVPVPSPTVQAPGSGGEASGAPGLERSDKARSALSRSGKPGAPEGEASMAPPSPLPNPEVEAKARRRRFTPTQKRRILEQAAACTEPGQIGALLRREGIYSSTLSKWRKRYAAGGEQALADDRRGRPAKRSPFDGEIERLRKENKRLEKRLRRAVAIVEIQKKISALLSEAETSETC